MPPFPPLPSDGSTDTSSHAGEGGNHVPSSPDRPSGDGQADDSSGAEGSGDTGRDHDETGGVVTGDVQDGGSGQAGGERSSSVSAGVKDTSGPQLAHTGSSELAGLAAGAGAATLLGGGLLLYSRRKNAMAS